MTDDTNGRYGRRRFLKGLGAATITAGLAGEGGAAPGSDRLVIGVEDGSTVEEVRERIAADTSIPGSARVVHHNETIDYAVVEIPSRGPAAQAADAAHEAVSDLDGVAYAETDYEVTTAVQEIEAVEPNDPRWGEEWAERAMNVPDAWETTLGSLDTTLAILDTGLDYEHPDLHERVTDDVGGPDPMPDGSDDHGTHCGGCASATTGNGVGVTGPTNSRLLGYNIFDNVRGEDAIVDATDKGADVISMSWSVGYETQQSLADAIQYAVDRGTVPLAASANDGRTDAVTYPASDPNVIAVGATDQSGAVADFSNSGPGLDLVAPGVNVLSTLPNGAYGNASGTSMACPCTAGVAALAKELDPGLDPENIRGLLTDTAAWLDGVPADRQAAGQVDAAAVVAALDGGGGGTQAPYNGTPHQIPGRIQAQEYDTGGEGVAYHDTNASNDGGAFRTDEGVDVEAASDSTGGEYNVCWVRSGEWIEYTVDVQTAGTYDIHVRTASDLGGGTMSFAFDGSNVTGSVDVPATGGWQSWQTATIEGVELSAGEQVMRVNMEADDFNHNWFEFEQVDGGGGGGGGAIAEGTYKILNVGSGMALDVQNASTDNGANVQQWNSNDCDCQVWDVQEVSSGVYSVRAVHSGKALDVSDVSQDPGANVHQWDYVGGGNQHWRIEDTGDGTYRLLADHSGLALDVEDGSTSAGANVLQWNYHGGAAQRFTFEPASGGDGGGDGGGGGGDYSGTSGDGWSASVASVGTDQVEWTFEPTNAAGWVDIHFVEPGTDAWAGYRMDGSGTSHTHTRDTSGDGGSIDFRFVYDDGAGGQYVSERRTHQY